MPARLNTNTVERVRVAAAELGYVVNGAGRALSSGRTGRIAVVTDDLSNPHFLAVLQGAQAPLRTGGYVPVVCALDDARGKEVDVVRSLRGVADGVVFAVGDHNGTELAGAIQGLPSVEITGHAAPASNRRVMLDDRGLVEALEHLAALGHRVVAVAQARRRTTWGRAFTAVAAIGRQLGLDVVLVGRFAPTRAAGRTVVDRADAVGATAIVAYCDVLAFGIVETLVAAERSVPGDVSVVGFGDVFGADLARPALTTVRLPLERAAREAVGQLLAEAGTGALEPHDVTMATSLIVRETSGPPSR